MSSDDLTVTTPFDWRAHVAIARPDHWFKNVFVLPGVAVALSERPHISWPDLLARAIVGLVAICLVASSNYTLNEILDAPTDRHHPTKHARPIPAGRVRIPLAYIQWLLLVAAGLLMATWISRSFVLPLFALWVMGCVYNVPPVRAKDQPYIDVLSEAINNPLRMVAGWYIVTNVTLPPASLLLGYWMIGSYFMALKRFAEVRQIDDTVRAAAYRRSFRFYTQDRLIVSVMFYSAAAMLFFGAFCMRYRLELIFSFPLVALVMALYLRVALRPNSAVQTPEHLYREPALMVAVIATAMLMLGLLWIDLPAAHRLFTPTAPAQYGPPS